MTKRYISQEDFIRYFRELSEDNKGDDLALAIYSTFTIKRKSPGTVECSCGCGKTAFYSDATNWLRIPNLQKLNRKKQWENLSGEELFFVSSKHLNKFLTSIPY